MQNNFNPQESGRPVKATGPEQENATLQWICRSALQTAFPIFHEANIDACFYPYIGLTHTIRRKGSGWMLRISDHCRHAPTPVLEAIVMILGSKIARRKTPSRSLQTYELYRKDPWVEESVRARRRLKGRKFMAKTGGKYFFPMEIYRDMNARFFNNQIEIQRIGWGQRKSWTRLGHYDPIHRTITLNPMLDSPKVPEYVVRYIVYHEMLHAVFEDSSSRRTRRHHPPEFRRAEQAYPDFQRAKEFLRVGFSRRRRTTAD
jgi:hypothetical protein